MRASAGRWIELPGQTLPAAEILALQLGGFQCEAGGPDHVARLDHERHRVTDTRRLRQIGRARAREGLGVGPVPRHAVVQARATRHEPFRLGVVHAVDQPHELAGHVAVEPRRPERMLPVSYTHLRAHETDSYLVCRLLLEKKKK